VRRRLPVAAALAVAAAFLFPQPAVAGADEQLVVVFLFGGLSFEEAVSIPLLRELAARGGIGLMAPPSDLQDNSGYLSFGAGRVMEGSRGPVVPPDGGAEAKVDLHSYIRGDASGSTGKLAESLAQAHINITYAPQNPTDEPGLLMVSNQRGTIPNSALGVVEEETAEEVGLVVFDFGRTHFGREGTTLAISTGLFLTGVLNPPDDHVLIVVASPAPTRSMVEQGDVASPVIVAELRGKEGEELPIFLPSDPPVTRPPHADLVPRGLTSGTSRRQGVVSVADVAPTILEFLGVPVPEEMTGSPIRVVGEAPTDLHAKFLEYQRVRVPTQAGAMALLLGAAAAGALLLFVPAPAGLRKATALVGVYAASIPIVLLAAGYLPTFSYAVLIPFLVGGSAAITVLAWRLGRNHSTSRFIVLAWVGLAALVVDSVLGWRGMVLSLLGGDALRGVRFYGLSNPYAGFLLAAAVLAATSLSVLWGAVLLVGAAVLGGAPTLGANLGAAITLAAAAGLWVAVRLRERLGLIELAIGAAAAAAGLALFLVWHALAPEPTHVTRVAAEAGRSGPGALAATAGRRLEILVRNTSRMPAAWLAVVGLPFGLAVAWRKPRPFRALLDGDPLWRWGVAVLAVSGMVGFLVNDTSSTAAVAFAYVGLGLLFPSLEARWTTPRTAK
jgi:hypothetical protein